MIDDTNTSLMFYPSNKQLSIGDKNVSGINIATNGASFETNCIKIGNSTNYPHLKGQTTVFVNTPVNSSVSYDFQNKFPFQIYDPGYPVGSGMAMKMGIYRDTGNGYIQVETGNTGTRSLCLQTQETSQYVGIGTTAPAYKLDVNGITRIRGDLYVGAGGATYADYAATGNTITGAIKFASPYGDSDWIDAGIYSRRYSANANNELTELLIYKGNDSNDRVRIKGGFISFDTGAQGSFDSADSIRMTILWNGNVGIGTTDPRYPLEISTNTAVLAITGKYWTNTAAPNTAYGASYASASIYAAYDIVTAAAFIVSSDSRIKTDIVDVDDDSALTLFRRLQPKTYEYKDKVAKGGDTVYGFIAQEVAEVLPRAAKIITDVIPNIYSLSNVSGDILAVDVSKLEYDASGQLFPKLKLIKEDNSELYVQILTVTPTTIQIDKTLTEEKVFVYGQEVNNFHTLDKNAIWTVAAAALQEVDRQLQAEKQKTSTLEEKLQTVVSQLEVLSARVLALETK